LEDFTMRRSVIGLILLLALGNLVPPLADAAPRAGKVPRLGVLSFYHPSSLLTRQGSPFWQELRERGWVEGRNLEVTRRYAEGHAERLPTLATALVQLPVDVLVAEGTQAAQAAKAASDTIPIVFMGVGDPVRAGLVTSLAHPGGNVTGPSMVLPDLSGKLLELLTEVAPGVSRVAVLTNTPTLSAEMTHTAQSLGLTLSPIAIATADQLDHAVVAMRTVHAEALLVAPAPLFNLELRRVLALAATSRLPAIYFFRSWVVAGGLMSYGPTAEATARAAYYVDRILKGAKPADLPVEQPMKFELVLNLTTAKALGLTIPLSLLFQADEVMDIATVTVPGPPEVMMTPPAADLPPELAAYSGTWEGAWGNVLKSRLIVEKIDAESARVVYAWADHPQGRFKGGWARVRAQVLPGGKLQWGDKAKFTFEMARDRMSIAGEREEAGDISTVIMRKVAP
jgi:putative tryptophan/tyrosine transport system substrate-binding protein